MANRTPQELVEDALFAFATNLLTAKPAFTPDALKGFISGFLMQYPEIHKALEAKGILLDLWEWAEGKKAIGKIVDRTGVYLDELEDAGV